jgi:hypothetical protein
MPFWFCHFFRLETSTSFAIAQFSFSEFNSVISLVIYSILICLNLLSISVDKTRFVAAIVSGMLHMAIGILHLARLITPFRFEVFNIEWPISSSLREVLIGIPFAVICFVIAGMVSKKK